MYRLYNILLRTVDHKHGSFCIPKARLIAKTYWKARGFDIKFIGILLMACIPFSGNAKAQTNPLFGVGHRTCSDWTSDQGTPSQLEDRQWVGGFLSGMVGMRSLLTHQNLVYNNTDVDLWIDTYCASHPNDELQVAAGALFFSPGLFSIEPAQ